MRYSLQKLQRGYHDSILHEVPRQERDQEPKESDHEERQAGDPGCLPEVRHQDVQDWEKLKLIRFDY